MAVPSTAAVQNPVGHRSAVVRRDEPKRRPWPRESLQGAVLLLGVAIYFWGLDAVPLQPGNEAMYAHPAAIMASGGDLLVPRYEHGPFLEKPPLTWWILASSYRLLGVSVFAERLPGAIAALATVLLLALWVRRVNGKAAALAAALALMYSFKFAALARTSPADTLLAFAVTLAVITLDGAARAEEARDWKWGILSGAALSFAFGIKGLVGLALPVGGVLTGLLLDRRRPVRAASRSAIALGTLILIVAPWHWAMSERFGGMFWKLFYWDNHIVRATTDAFVDHPRGPFFYLPLIALSAFPWSLFVLSGFLRRSWRGSSAPAGWLLFGLIFFSSMTIKREVYLMPLFPAVAAIVGGYLGNPERRMQRTQFIWACSAVVPLAALVFWFRMRSIVSALAGNTAYLALGVSLAALLASLLAAARFARSRWPLGCVSASCALFFFSFILTETRLARYDPFPRFGRAVAERCMAGCTGYRVRLAYTSIDFYSGFEWEDVEDPLDVPTLGRQPAFAVLRENDVDLLRATKRPVSVVERRPWLNENWVTAALHPERFRLVDLDLVRLGEAQPAPLATRALPGSPTRRLGQVAGKTPRRLWMKGPASASIRPR